MWKSEDRGLHWTAVNKGMLDVGVESIAVSSDDTVYAVTGASPPQPLRRRDKGSIWTDLATAVPSFSGGTLWAASDPPGALFLVDHKGQVDVSCDGDDHWLVLVAPTGGPSSLITFSADGSVVLLAGSEGSGAFRASVH